MIKKSKQVLLAMLSTMALQGCSVVPTKLTSEHVVQSVSEDNEKIFQSQEPLETPLTLGQVIARAAKYNLSHRVDLMTEALSSANFELVKMDMLPVLALSAGHSERNNYNAASSRSIETGQESLVPSTSQDRHLTNANIRFAWNALDFGMSYLQAKQEADRYLIAKNNRKNAMLKLLHEATATYWRALAMQQLDTELSELLGRTRNSLKKLQVIRKERLKPPLVTLKDIRTLIELNQQLEMMKQTINQSKMELATLINEKLDKPVNLAAVSELKPLPKNVGNLEDLEMFSLVNSADYVGELYNARIEQIESRKALVSMLPSLDFSYGLNYDSNSFLVNNQWHQAGIQLSWNIIRLLAWDAMENQETAKKHLSLGRRLATNMAIITKFHLSWQGYQNSLVRLQQANELEAVDTEISGLTKNAKSIRSMTDVQLIQSELVGFRSRMAKMLAYAEAQKAFGEFLLSTGVNPIPENYQEYPLDELAAYVDDVFAQWQRGIVCCNDLAENSSQLVENRLSLNSL